MTKSDITKFSNKPEILIYSLLGQVSLIQDIDLYIPDGSSFIPMLKAMGAKVHVAPINKGSALYYKVADGAHYLKLVGPKCPKGGGLYLTKKMETGKFLLFLEAFTRGILLREIRDRVNNPTKAATEMLKVVPNDPFDYPVEDAILDK